MSATYRVPPGRESRFQAFEGVCQRRPHLVSLAEYKKIYARVDQVARESFGRNRPPTCSGARSGQRFSSGGCRFAKWFVGAKLNVAENCLDRHLSGPRRNKAAIIWEGEPGERRVLTYQQLHREVCVFANILKRNGCKKGRACSFTCRTFPRRLSPCSHVPASALSHSVVFGGFSSESIKDRIADSGASIVITADGGYRRGQIITLKQNVDQALEGSKTVRACHRFSPHSSRRPHQAKTATSGGTARPNT